jgi:hypothetical protein
MNWLQPLRELLIIAAITFWVIAAALLLELVRE